MKSREHSSNNKKLIKKLIFKEVKRRNYCKIKINKYLIKINRNLFKK